MEHVKNVENLLQRLREHGIKSNLAKCNFFKREVIYQGRPISKDGTTQTYKIMTHLRSLELHQKSLAN